MTKVREFAFGERGRLKHLLKRIAIHNKVCSFSTSFIPFPFIDSFFLVAYCSRDFTRCSLEPLDQSVWQGQTDRFAAPPCFPIS